MPPDPRATDADFAGRLESLRREQDRLVGQLLAGERRFRRLARSVWAVQERERRRLARELHDGVGQLLTALKQQLELARGEDEEDRDERLGDALELAGRALEDTRELSRLLRPAILDDLGLEPGLRWLTRTHEERTGVTVDLRCRHLDERFGDELETLVFRVVQEALTNAAKHAEAERIEVTVERSTGELRIEVRDDGRGLDPARVETGREGMGLRGMRDRVELFDGRLDVASPPGEGTRLAVRIPLEGSD